MGAALFEAEANEQAAQQAELARLQQVQARLDQTMAALRRGSCSMAAKLRGDLSKLRVLYAPALRTIVGAMRRLVAMRKAQWVDEWLATLAALGEEAASERVEQRAAAEATAKADKILKLKQAAAKRRAMALELYASRRGAA